MHAGHLKFMTWAAAYDAVTADLTGARESPPAVAS
jgi:hypothetical protein